MEELDESSSKYYYYWHQQADDLLGEELSMMSSSELIEYETAAPPPTTDDSKQQVGGDDEEEGPRRRRESMVNKLISTVYSGPTISDIESALSFTGGGDHLQQLNKYSSTSPVVFSPEKVLSKMENKYTLKIKTCGNNGLAEDGYKWRKYGQKSIKNSPNPRSYYRCTNPRCNAKKQVERATDEPDTLLVTYEGLHLHYTYSHFLHAAQAHQQQGLPKKPKKGPLLLDTDDGPTTQQQQPIMLNLDGPAAHPHVDVKNGGKSSEHDAAASSCRRRYYCHLDDDDHGRERDDEQQQHLDMAASNGGGLLEDVVPLRVRRPLCNGSLSSRAETTSSSSPSPSLASTSSSVSCWTPTSPYIDMAILSNIF